MSPNFFYSHLDFFPKKLWRVNEETDKRLHQDMAIIKTRFKWKWNASMMADYCWEKETNEVKYTKERF